MIRICNKLMLIETQPFRVSVLLLFQDRCEGQLKQQFCIILFFEQCFIINMEYERYNKARLTIQICSFPTQNNSTQKHRELQKQRTSLVFLSHNNQKKRIQNSQVHNEINKIAQIFKAQRKSEGLHKIRDKFSSNLFNLPEIRLKTCRQEEIRKKSETIKTYSSTKLSVGPYHKIQALISDKYNSKMEIFNKKEKLESKKTLMISEINGEGLEIQKDQRKRIKQQIKPKVKSMQKTTKTHLNRMKNQLEMPLQLLSQRCQQKEIDTKTHNLQMKNIVRFEYVSKIDSLRQKQRPKKQRHQQMKLEGWKFEAKNSIPSFHFQY